MLSQPNTLPGRTPPSSSAFPLSSRMAKACCRVLSRHTKEANRSLDVGFWSPSCLVCADADPNQAGPRPWPFQTMLFIHIGKNGP